jgi:serine phosphatase RsbU (regulator of sigma subunit)
MMAVLHDPAADRDFPIPGARHLIGRAPECDVRLTDPLVSGRHAAVTRAGGSYLIEDLGSRNGTRVNGDPVKAAIPIHPGDRIEVGGHLLLFRADPPTTRADATAAPPGVVKSVDLTAVVKTEVSPAAKLRAVLELSRNLGSTLELKEVLPRILESLFTLFPQADRGFVVLPDLATGRLVPRAARHRGTPDDSATVSRTVIDHAAAVKRAVLVVDAGQDERFTASESIRMNRLRSLMCVPMLGRDGDCLGAIELDTRDVNRAFTQDDLDVLAVAGLLAARALELARLHLEQRELQAATQIQRSFLPADRPRVDGLRFFDYYASAGQVGGDYYDYVRLGPDRLAVAVGDVAGKGVTAALLMAQLSATARFCLATEPTVSAAVRQISAGVTRACGKDRFITLTVGVLDLANHAITVVNAGHMPPLRRHADGTISEVGAETSGIPLGVFDRPYNEVTVSVEPGDVFVFYTDGVTEARDPGGVMYGPDRLRKAIHETKGGAGEVGQAVLADVQRFAAGRPPSDDLTLVVVSRDA